MTDDPDLARLDDDGAPPPPDPAVPVPTAEDMAVDLAALMEWVVANRPAWTKLPHAGAAACAVRRAVYAESEVLRLRGMVRGMAARIAAAHEVIARNAERRPLPPGLDLAEED